MKTTRDYNKNFNLYTKSIFEKINQESFLKLYLPIIGSDAFALYLFLLNSLDTVSKEFLHSTIKNNLQLSTLKLEKALFVLEAINLVQTFETEKSFFYELQKPQNVIEFMNDPILSSLLYNKNQEIYNEIIEEIKELNKIKVGINISKKFFEIFENTKIKENSQKVEYNKITLEGNFNINIFNKIFPYPTTKKNAEKIQKFALLYNFKEKDMLDLCIASLNEYQEIDFEKLNFFATKKYHSNTQIKTKQFSKTTTDSSDLITKYLVQLDNLSPIEFLKNKNGGALPTKRDINIVNELIITYGLSSGVVNVLLEYVLKNNNKILTKNFVETLAGQMQRSGASNAGEAMNILKKSEESKNKPKYKNKKSEVVPEWIDKEIKSIPDDELMKEQFFKGLEEK